MVSSTSPNKGVQTDITITEQDPSFARESINGRFTSVGNDYSWRSNDRLKSVFAETNTKYLGSFEYQDYTYLFVIISGYFQIIRVQLINNNDVQALVMFTKWNSSIFNFSESNPINNCVFWSNISGTKLKVYFSTSDGVPYAIDLLDQNNSTYNIDDFKFAFKVDPLRLHLYQVENGGSLLCGKYYYAIQGFKPSGILTDWYMMPNAVEVPNLIPTTFTRDGYQAIEGGSNQLKSKCKVTLYLEDSTGFSSTLHVRIAAFYALDEYKIDTGQIIYEGLIKTGKFVHSQNIGLRSIDIEEVKKSTLSIKSIGVMSANSDLNVIGNVEVNEYAPRDFVGSYFGFYDNVKFLVSPSLKLKKYSDDISEGSLDSRIWLDVLLKTKIENYTKTSGKAAQASEKKIGDIYDSFHYHRTYKKHNASSWNTRPIPMGVGYMDYTNPSYSYWKKIYRMGEQVRIGFLPYDLTGKPMRPIWINDLGTVNISQNNVPDSHFMSEGNTQKAHKAHFYVDSKYKQKVGVDFNWLEIYDLYLTQFVSNGQPLISGFSIVQAEPLQKRIVTEGVATRINWINGNKKDIVPFYQNDSGAHTPGRHGDGWMIIYSGDVFFETENIPREGDTIVVTGVAEGYYENDGNITEYHNQTNKNINKIYSGLPMALSGQIEKIIELPFFPDVASITVEGLGEIHNQGRGVGGNLGIGHRKSLLIKVKATTATDDLYAMIKDFEGGYYGAEGGVDNFIKYFLYRVERTSYGFPGIDDNNLANSTYKHVGHYQKVDAAFLSEIKINDEYRCDIAVYGGQYYANILEVIRLEKYTGSADDVANMVYVPVISDFNIRMRTGARHSKYRTLGENTPGTYSNPQGIGIGSGTYQGNGQHEDLLLNKSYTSRSNTKEYIPIGIDFDITTMFKYVLFWSEKQALQGDADYFRVFDPTSYAICDTSGQEVMGLEFTADKLFVFQKNSVGFLPYKERTLGKSANSQDFVVSYGEIFPKYELISSNKGITNGMHKVKTNLGILFFDSLRMSLNIINESIENFGTKLFINKLIKDNLTNVSRILFDRYDSKIMICTDKKILEIATDPLVVNGIINLDLFTKLYLSMCGDKVAFINKIALPQHQGDQSDHLIIYLEDPSGVIQMNSSYQITILLGADAPTVLHKIFDNFIIHSRSGLLPQEVQFTVGDKTSEFEILADNENVLINGSVIYMNAPFVSIPNSAGVINYSRLDDSQICLLTLRSVDRFALDKVVTEFRNML